MTYLGSSFRSMPLARPMYFKGSPVNKEIAARETLVPASPSTESEASSIHTNPEGQGHIKAVKQTLDELKGKIPKEQWDILVKGANFAQIEINRLKHSGRKWQKEADNIASDHEYASDQLDEKIAELNKAQQEKQTLEQKFAEQARKYAEQGEKLKHTEQELKDYLADQKELDEAIARLTLESEAIRKDLDSKRVAE